MKKLFSTFVVVTAIAGGSAIASDGPAPLTMAEMDSISAGASASAKGSTSLSWGYHSVKVKNRTKAKAHGNVLEAAGASQATGVQGIGINGLVGWQAIGSTESHSAALSYGYHYGYH